MTITEKECKTNYIEHQPYIVKEEKEIDSPLCSSFKGTLCRKCCHQVLKVELSLYIHSLPLSFKSTKKTIVDI